MIKKTLLLPILFAFGCVQNGQQFQQGVYNVNNPQSPSYYANLGERDEEPEDQYTSEEIFFLNEVSTITKDYRTFPDAPEVNAFIDGMVSAKKTRCHEEMARAHRKQAQAQNPAALGARKLLSSFYQSCDALDTAIDKDTPVAKGVKVSSSSSAPGKVRTLVNKDRYISSHYLLSKLDKQPGYPGEQCHSALETPPIYGYGSRKLPNSSGDIRLRSKGVGVTSRSQSAAGIDCSSFVSVAMATHGLKMTPDSGAFFPVTTRSLGDLVDRSPASRSCVERKSFDSSKSLESGDIINYSGKHVIMVDTVGEDPLGIKKAVASGQCSDITVASFDFTYIHSGSLGGSVGPSRVHSSRHVKSQDSMFNNLVLSARKSCKSILKGEEELGGKDLVGTKRFSVMRHKTENPECLSDKKVTLENEECINSCYAKNNGASS
ncbi:hypothetical protein HBN50_02430 [Halobacteriovorax sp. GB3]|uniref:hypothetical protein n=1 Tax=Halobacteriovorax sp. GB3 TaxID=2719615 RepID=UPI00235F553F|nr:hypothetical protein [Halobacteriovorax sp. GB3]MDD0851930.1 hypothetical protein [Halobacteriovorax sp. GB3]